jgi:hypothetical protein
MRQPSNADASAANDLIQLPLHLPITAALNRVRCKRSLGRVCERGAREIELELHLTHLNRRLDVGVVRDVAHDLASVWAERRLKGLHGIKVEMAHGAKRRW